MLFIDQKKKSPRYGFENYCIEKTDIKTWAYTDTKRSVLSPHFEKLFPDKKTLDIGAGAGFFSWLALQYGAIPTINETQNEGLLEAQKLLNGNGIFRNDNMILNLDEKEEKTFDYIIALTVIHWLWKPIGEENQELLKRSNISYRWPGTADGLDEVFRRFNFYIKTGMFIDFFRNKNSNQSYQKELFEERLAANYSVSILAQVDEPHFDATIYYAHL